MRIPTCTGCPTVLDRFYDFTLIGRYARWGSNRSVTDPGQFGRGEKQLTRLRDYVTENFSEAGPRLVVRLGPAGS